MTKNNEIYNLQNNSKQEVTLSYDTGKVTTNRKQTSAVGQLNGNFHSVNQPVQNYAGQSSSHGKSADMMAEEILVDLAFFEINHFSDVHIFLNQIHLSILLQQVQEYPAA